MNVQDPKAALPEPSHGGSYTRDPGSGELVLTERTGLDPVEREGKRSAPQQDADDIPGTELSPAADVTTTDRGAAQLGAVHLIDEE
jgi:hypothetical protein